MDVIEYCYNSMFVLWPTFGLVGEILIRQTRGLGMGGGE